MNQALFSFSALGYPVQVSWTALLLLFFLGASKAGMGVDANAVAKAVVFAAIVFFSILVHELGHALVGERLGLRPRRIVLHGFGGLCEYERRPSPRQGVISAMAGPVFGLALGGIAWGLLVFLGERLPYGGHWLLVELAFINVFWSLFNLLPIFPMDGGHVLSHGLQMKLKPLQAWKITRAVSLVLAILVAIAGFYLGMRFVGVIMLLIVLQNFQRS